MLVTYVVNFRYLNDRLFGKELFIRLTASAFRKLPSIYVLSYFPFGFEGRVWDLIVSVPDHCLSFYFSHHEHCFMCYILIGNLHWLMFSILLYASLISCNRQLSSNCFKVCYFFICHIKIIRKNTDTVCFSDGISSKPRQVIYSVLLIGIFK